MNTTPNLHIVAMDGEDTTCKAVDDVVAVIEIDISDACRAYTGSKGLYMTFGLNNCVGFLQ